MAHQILQFFIHCLRVLIWNYNLVVARLLNTILGGQPLKPAPRRQISYLLEAPPMAEEEDRRPKSSPFEGPSVEVIFGDSRSLFVPSSLFPDRLKTAKWPPREMKMDSMNSDVGHVVFYYLLTGTYQCLKPTGTLSHEKLTTELTTSVGVYNASRKYHLPALQESAQEEIQRLAKELPFPHVLNLLRSLHLSPSAREGWLDDYVQWGLKNVFETPAAFLDNTTLQVDHDVISFSNIILKSLARLLANGMAPDRKDDVAVPVPSPKPTVLEAQPIADEEPCAEPPEMLLSREIEAAIKEEIVEYPLSEFRKSLSDLRTPEAEPELVYDRASDIERRMRDMHSSQMPWPTEEPIEMPKAEEPVLIEAIPEPPETAPMYPPPDEYDEPEPEPEIKSVSVPETKPEPEPVLEPVLEPVPEPVPETKPEPVPETQLEPVPETELKPEVEAAPAPPRPLKKKKKKASIVAPEAAQPPVAEPVNVLNGAPIVEEPQPVLVAAPVVVAEPEPILADDKVASAAPSVAEAPKKKKKKRLSLFWTEDTAS
ncbi:putative G-protein coupled receptor [Rosellinia necatrix]|uniref:Putative G-protein coupled receptor n=1 Tax=Rosellinia necatrix TaxID=77044 RepID=A0A1W2TMK9_ROSNE|nr:putative G-protein coupled receptor [Rosellinia necatrix]